jgi:Helix-turn-helix domain
MSTTKTKAPARQCAGLAHIELTNAGNSSTAQCHRLLSALRRGPITTFQARQLLDIPHPAGRVQNLRDAGYHIVTHWCDDLSSAGRKHHVARYVLMGGQP